MSRKGPGKVAPPPSVYQETIAEVRAELKERASRQRAAHRMVDRPTVAPLVPDAGAELPRPAKPPSKAAAAHVDGCRCGACPKRGADHGR